MLDTLTRQQRLLLVAGGILAAVIFVILTVYYGAAATGHPRVKHMILFIVLAVLGLLAAWFSWPAASEPRQRR